MHCTVREDLSTWTTTRLAAATVRFTKLTPLGEIRHLDSPCAAYIMGPSPVRLPRPAPRHFDVPVPVPRTLHPWPSRSSPSTRPISPPSGSRPSFMVRPTSIQPLYSNTYLPPSAPGCALRVGSPLAARHQPVSVLLLRLRPALPAHAQDHADRLLGRGAHVPVLDRARLAGLLPPHPRVHRPARPAGGAWGVLLGRLHPAERREGHHPLRELHPRGQHRGALSWAPCRF